QRFWQGAKYPQYRYFDPFDKYARIGTGSLGNNKPMQWDNGGRWSNSDPPVGSSYYYQGNMRFWHSRNKDCNTGFADGHVEPVLQKDVLRYMFMIKWPSGVRRSPAVP